MRRAIFLHFLLGISAWLIASQLVSAEDPYRFFTWVVEYGEIAPLGVKQRGILINKQFPGPNIDGVTNDNIIVNVINKLDEPFLITWNGIKQRKSSWEDGVLGTNCPIPSNSNWTYKMQLKDQIGTYNYYPSTSMHRVAGGFGGLNILQRSVIPIPYPIPLQQFTILVSDWWKTDFKVCNQTETLIEIANYFSDEWHLFLSELRRSNIFNPPGTTTNIRFGKPFPFPDALLINGLPQSTSFTGIKGQTYMFRVSNMALTTSINFRIQNHTLVLIEVEGSHTMQEVYESLDIHPGQTAAFLVTLSATVKDYFIVASTRFTKTIRTASAVLQYEGSTTKPSLPLPIGPTYQIHWSMKQARTIRWNLTANAARPNPQGSYHYGTIPIVRTLVLGNSADNINGKPQYSINKISYVNPETPLKLADYFNIPGVFVLNGIKDTPPAGPAVTGTSVFGITLHDYVEVIFQNNESTLQSYHLDGNDFWAVGYGSGQWNATLRKKYNLVDATTRNTVQVYPNSWSAILISMDNKGMWNLRSAIWPRRYLGQELYMRVWNNERSIYTEYEIPDNALLCGKVKK